jgi:hypothetical protein
VDVDAARGFAVGLNLHTAIEAQAAQWIGYLTDQLEWARDEIASLRDREDCRD